MNEINERVSEQELPTLPTDRPLAEFGADLTKEEFVSFALTAGRDPRKIKQLRNVSLISTAILVLFCGYQVYDMFRLYGTIDWSSIGILGIAVWLFFFTRFGWPHIMRRRAEKQYEKSLQMGHTYYGTVRIFARYAEKQTAERTTTLLFNRETRFMEREDVMAIGQPGSPALILPARYLTEESANAIRAAVFTNVPRENCQLISRLCALATEPMPAPSFEESEEETPPQRISIHYTPEESGAFFKEMVYTAFTDRLPIVSVISLLSGVAFWLLEDNPVIGAGAFAALMLLAYLLRVVFPLQKNKQRLKNATPEELSCILSVSNKGIILSGKALPPFSLPWKAITRAVSEPLYIRLYAEKTQVIIPKRCLENVEEFCETVDRYMEVNPRGES